MPDLFADSFALVAYLEGNPRYLRIFEQRKIVTSALNVLEVYATLLRRIDAAEAREIAMTLLTLALPLPSEVALSAAEFRHAMRRRKRDCSYVDAWGYAAAVHLGVRFLTGDTAFRGLQNVEFVR